MSDTLLEREREKYRKAWKTELYHEHSPGYRAALDVSAAVFGLNARSLTDYGCGNGRALEVFSAKLPGLSLYGVDLVATDAGARERVPTATIFDACLWDLPAELPTSDFAFSCDVLEHLPQPFVRPTLEAIAARTRLGGYLQVFTAPHNCREIREELHLTVQPVEWWREEIERVFRVSILVVDGVRPKFWVRAR